MPFTIALKYRENTTPCIIEATNKIWNGICMFVPRAHVDLIRNDAIASRGGVYILLNDTDVYVGKASVRANKNGILTRVLEHTEPWWNACILITSHDNNSFSLDVQAMLENEITQLVSKNTTYNVRNRNTPPTTEVDEEEFEHLKYITVILQAFGVRFKENVNNVPTPQKKKTVPQKQVLFYYRYKRGTPFDAYGYVDGNKFVVCKGSRIRPLEEKAQSGRPGAIKNRALYADKIRDNVLVEDILFDSPTAAGTFVSVNNVSGNLKWVDEHGVTLGEHLKNDK